MNEKLKDAIKTVIDNDYAIIYSDVFFYKSMNGDSYILTKDDPVIIVNEHEECVVSETYEDFDSAYESFCKHNKNDVD